MRTIATHASTRIISAVLCCLMVVGCGTTSQFTPGAGRKYLYRYTMTRPVNDAEMIFQDDRIGVRFTIDEGAVLFRLQNRTDRIIRILWDKVVIGVNGRFQRARHATDLYADSLDVRPFPLPGQGYIRDLILPAGNIRIRKGRWVERDLFATVDNGTDSIRARILANTGRQVRVLLPIQDQSQITEYEFEFVVRSVVEVPWREYAPAPRDPNPPDLPRPRTKDQQTVTIAIVVGFLAMFALLISADKDPPSE